MTDCALRLRKFMSIDAVRTSICLMACGCTLLALAQDVFAGCEGAAGITLAERLLQDKRYDEAARALDTARNCGRFSAAETFQLGWLYGRARRFADALKVFETVPDDVPDRVSHQYAVALSNFELANYGNAVKVLSALDASGSLNPESANLLSVSYSKLGLYKQAESTLAKEIQSHANDLTARLNLVTLYADQDRFQEAATIASNAAEAFPNDSRVFVVRGAADTLIGQLDRAYDYFSTAAKLDPVSSDPQFFLALTRYKQGRFADAIQSLEAANKSGIVDSDLHYLLAECLLKVDASGMQAAMTELNLAIELNANSVSARAVRGKLLLEASRAKEAAADLKIAYQRDPGSRSAAYNLARAYRAMGRAEEAQRLFGQLRSQKSDSLGELSQRRLNEVLTQKGADR
jgi:tetratricopeptide (TPR) repeat protein